MKARYVCILLVAILMAACGKQADNAVGSATPTSSPAAAVGASPIDAALPGVGKAAYTGQLNLSLGTMGESDWKSFYQTTVDALSNSNTTTSDQLAAVKFPGYSSIRNPFDKQQFVDAHKADLIITAKAPARLKLLFDGRGYLPVIMYAGDPLKGHYEWQGDFQQMMVGYSWEDVTDTVDGKGVMHEKRVFTTVRYHLNSFAPRINRKYQKDVSVESAKQIETELKRDNNGNESLPAIVYATVQSVQVTGNDDQSNRGIDVNLSVDGFDVAAGKEKEIKPLFN